MQRAGRVRIDRLPRRKVFLSGRGLALPLHSAVCRKELKLRSPDAAE